MCVTAAHICSSDFLSVREHTQQQSPAYMAHLSPQNPRAAMYDLLANHCIHTSVVKQMVTRSPCKHFITPYLA